MSFSPLTPSKNMARRKSSNPLDTKTEPELDMSPMVDVAFLLLIYFIAATQLLQEEADLSMVLPGIASTKSDAVKIDQMQVRIDQTSSVWVNDEMVETAASSRSLPALTDRLERYAASARLGNSDAMVVLECRNEASHQRFIDVLNACTAVGIDNITLKQ